MYILHKERVKEQIFSHLFNPSLIYSDICTLWRGQKGFCALSQLHDKWEHCCHRKWSWLRWRPEAASNHSCSRFVIKSSTKTMNSKNAPLENIAKFTILQFWLSSETLNTWHLCNLIIKSDTGQHSQLLRCLHNQCAPSYFFDQSSISMLVVAAPTLTAAWPSPRSFTSCKVLFLGGDFSFFCGTST